MVASSFDLLRLRRWGVPPQSRVPVASRGSGAPPKPRFYHHKRAPRGTPPGRPLRGPRRNFQNGGGREGGPPSLPLSREDGGAPLHSGGRGGGAPCVSVFLLFLFAWCREGGPSRDFSMKGTPWNGGSLRGPERRASGEEGTTKRKGPPEGNG